MHLVQISVVTHCQQQNYHANWHIS